MAVRLHETCQEYLKRRLSEGWELLFVDGFKAILISPEGIIRPLDLRNDIETLRPNADGTYTQIPFSEGSRPHFDSVDEAIADGETTYVATTSGPHIDTYEIPDSGVGEGVITSVKVYAVAWDEGDGNHTQRIVIYTHSTLYYGDLEVLSSSWIPYSKTWTENPNTTAPWTWAEINALEIGIELDDIGVLFPYCTQVYVEIDYSEEVAFIPTVTII